VRFTDILRKGKVHCYVIQLQGFRKLRSKAEPGLTGRQREKQGRGICAVKGGGKQNRGGGTDALEFRQNTMTGPQIPTAGNGQTVRLGDREESSVK